MCKTGVLNKHTAGESVGDPNKLDSGDDCSSDDSGSSIEHKTSSITTPRYAASPGFRSSSKGKMVHMVIDGEYAGGSFTAVLDSQEHQDRSWLDIDDFPDRHLGSEDKFQEIGNNGHKLGPDAPGGKGGMANSGDDLIADIKMGGIEVDGFESHIKDGDRAGVGRNAEGEQNTSDVQALQAPIPSSSCPSMARRGCGRPRHSRPTITVGNTIWEVVKLAGINGQASDSALDGIIKILDPISSKEHDASIVLKLTKKNRDTGIIVAVHGACLFKCIRFIQED